MILEQLRQVIVAPIKQQQHTVVLKSSAFVLINKSSILIIIFIQNLIYDLLWKKLPVCVFYNKYNKRDLSLDILKVADPQLVYAFLYMFLSPGCFSIWDYWCHFTPSFEFSSESHLSGIFWVSPATMLSLSEEANWREYKLRSYCLLLVASASKSHHPILNASLSSFFFFTLKVPMT